MKNDLEDIIKEVGLDRHEAFDAYQSDMKHLNGLQNSGNFAMNMGNMTNQVQIVCESRGKYQYADELYKRLVQRHNYVQETVYGEAGRSIEVEYLESDSQGRY